MYEPLSHGAMGIARKIGEVVVEHARRAFKGEGGCKSLQLVSKDQWGSHLCACPNWKPFSYVTKAEKKTLNRIIEGFLKSKLKMFTTSLVFTLVELLIFFLFNFILPDLKYFSISP